MTRFADIKGISSLKRLSQGLVLKIKTLEIMLHFRQSFSKVILIIISAALTCHC